MSAEQTHRGCEDPPPYSVKPPTYQAGEPPPGYQPYPGPPPPPVWQNYGATTAPVQHAALVVHNVGACPVCRIGILEDDFPCIAICCAIFFFPIGLIACVLLKSRRCSNCGAIFG